MQKRIYGAMVLGIIICSFTFIKVQKKLIRQEGYDIECFVYWFRFIGSYSFTEVGDAPLSEKLETIIEGKKKPKSPDLKNAYSGKTISDKLVTKLERIMMPELRKNGASLNDSKEYLLSLYCWQDS